MMAAAAEGAASKDEVVLRRKIVELQPMDEHRLAWADAALRFNDATAAGQALAKVAGVAARSE